MRVWQPPKPREEPAPSQPVPARRTNISTPTTNTTHNSPIKKIEEPAKSSTWSYQPPTITRSQPAPAASSPVKEVKKQEETTAPVAPARAHIR